MQPRDDFEAFCQSIGCEPNDERFVFWLAALRSTHNQLPAAYAPIDLQGVPLAVWSAMNPAAEVRQIPLYRHPVATIDKPALDPASAELVAKNYEGDPLGLALFFHRYYLGR